MYGRAMIDHTGIRVSDLEKSIAFYTKALAPLGYTLLAKFPGGAGFGMNNKPDFWLDGTDNGAPGERPHYHEHYYGAFVRDPDGHNIEACCHEPFLG